MALPRYQVSVNDKTVSVQVLAWDGNLMRLGIGERSYEVAIQADNSATVFATHHTETKIAHPTPAAKPRTASKSPGEVRAPIPGIITQIPVQIGQSVTRGMTVAVVEAMKMENNISAHEDGTVEQVLVKAGQEIDGGQLLIKLLPLAAA